MFCVLITGGCGIFVEQINDYRFNIALFLWGEISLNVNPSDLGRSFVKFKQYTFTEFLLLLALI